MKYLTILMLLIFLTACGRYQPGRAIEAPQDLCAQYLQRAADFSKVFVETQRQCFQLRERSACLQYYSQREESAKLQAEAQAECAKPKTAPPVIAPPPQPVPQPTPPPTPPIVTPQVPSKPAPQPTLPLTQPLILFTEDFEGTLQGWEGHTDAFKITDKYAKSGTRALINQDQYDKWLARTIGDYPEISYSCWFYDGLGSIAETVCLVSRDRYASQDMLLIGTETQKSPDYYSYFLSPDVASWGTTRIRRSLGWHNARFVKQNGVTDLYLDGMKIASTTNINDWKKIGVALNNWYASPGHEPALFDALRVYKAPIVCDDPLAPGGKADCPPESTKRLAACIKSCVAESEK